jgi:ketosteroid isomerase-like protein
VTHEEIVRAGWETLNARDLERHLLAYDPKVEVHSGIAGLVEGATPLHGVDAQRAGLENTFATFEVFAGEVRQFLDLPPHGLVVVWLRARGGASGVEIEQEFFQVITFAGERVVRIKNTLDAAEALEDLAAQLRG